MSIPTITESPCPACNSPQKKALRSHLTDVEAHVPGQYGIARCLDCRFIYLSPRPSASSLKSCYPDTYYTLLTAKRSSLSQKLYLPRYKFRRHRIQKVYQGIPSSLLEIGYGDGAFLAHLKVKWGMRCQLAGIDFKPPLNRQHLFGIDLMEGDFLQFQFKALYDVIVMYDVLEHLPYPIETLRHVHQFLKPGGLLFIQVPNWNSFGRILFPKHWSGLQIPRHQVFLTRKSFKKMLSKTGFELKRFNPVFDPGDFSVSFCNWLSDFFKLRTLPRQAWFFMPATVIFAPLVFLQSLFFKNSGEVEFVVQKMMSSPSRQYLFDLPIDCLSLKETLDWIENVIQKKEPRQHTVINAAKIVLAQKDPELKKSILESDLINIDGQPVVWAARWLGIPIKEKVSGSDLIVQLLKLAEKKQWRVFFLGAKQKTLEKMLEQLKKEYPALKIAGAQDGYFKKEEAKPIAYRIQATKADILFVGMPTPKKENFIRDYKAIMQVPFSMGVGGTFDVLSGQVRRAPTWVQKIGCEWLFRLCQEPRRLWKRYLKTNTLFLYMVFRARLFPRKGS